MKHLLLLTLLLCTATAEAKPRKGKLFTSGKAYCPHPDRQSFGVAVGWADKGGRKKGKRHRLSVYQ